MPARLEWLLEDYIINQIYSGDVTVEDIQEMTSQGMNLMQNATRPLHFIVDTRQMKKNPSLIALRKVNYGSGGKNQGFIIQIAKKGLFQFLTSTISQWVGIRIYFRDTFPEALALLAQLDPALPDLSTLRDPLDSSKV